MVPHVQRLAHYLGGNFSLSRLRWNAHGTPMSQNWTSRDAERAFARVAMVSSPYRCAMSFGVKIEQQLRIYLRIWQTPVYRP